MADKDTDKEKEAAGAGRPKMNAKDIRDMLASLAVGGTSAPADMDKGEHKFWGTQPVPWAAAAAAAAVAPSSSSAGPPAAEQPTTAKPAKPPPDAPLAEGPIDTQTDPSKIPAAPLPLLDGFEWVTMDMSSPAETHDVYELLHLNYVEDAEAMFRFNYSAPFLDWALKSPGWRADWHVGIRATASRKLVAFISGVPVTLRVRGADVRACEVNFMCVHKKLRAKRLAPVLIREITRRCNRAGVWQAIYTAGVLVHPPVATCRYFHRALDWAKLYDVGFSPMPAGSSRQRQALRYRLPERTATKGLRPLASADVPAAAALLERYLGRRAALSQRFSPEEAGHWLLNVGGGEGAGERVVRAFVVDDGRGGVSDLVSFYGLDSTVIQGGQHKTIRAAYLFYYATDAAFSAGEQGSGDAGLKARLNALVGDALVLAKRDGFDVFNALSLLDNPLFLAELRFGPGDGRLHYYLYNYRTAALPGGLDARMGLDAGQMGGVGVVML